jgi:hypothetical protein
MCDQKFGMAIVIDVLRGSKSAKVMERKFDRLPTHGIYRPPHAPRRVLLLLPVAVWHNGPPLALEGDLR